MGICQPDNLDINHYITKEQIYKKANTIKNNLSKFKQSKDTANTISSLN